MLTRATIFVNVTAIGNLTNLDKNTNNSLLANRCGREGRGYHSNHTKRLIMPKNSTMHGSDISNSASQSGIKLLGQPILVL